MSGAPVFVFPLEVPTWGFTNEQLASGWTAPVIDPTGVSPAALHNPSLLDIDYSAFLAATEPVQQNTIVAPALAVEEESSSSSSSADGTPTHLSPRNSWSAASGPAVVPEAFSAPALALASATVPTPVPATATSSTTRIAAANSNDVMERLMQLIAWPAGGARAIQAKKRPRSEHEYSKEKHLQTEKRRREDMSEAIDMIHRIMPESRMDKKLTKVDILQDAALYFAKLQAVALQLVEENAALRARAKAAAAASDATATAALL